TAAAKASFMALLEGEFPGRVDVELPGGEVASMVVFPGEMTTDSSSCVVIKDAGDDPDVTHAREIGCKLSRSAHPGVHFHRGRGVGVVIMPGLQVEVGEPAINPAPRTMITGALEKLSEAYEEEPAFDVEPFIPGGEELARKTFNPRVGVEGGLSVLGTTGRVVPFSNEAFVASIAQQLSVLASNGAEELVLTSGKRSENNVRQEFSHLPAMAFVHFGNLIGPTLEKAVEYGFGKIHLVIRFGKGVKLAAGNLDTHSRHVSFDPEFLAGIAATCGVTPEQTARIKNQKLANAVPDILPFHQYPCFYFTVARSCYDVCKPLLSDDAQLRVVLMINDHHRVVVPEN
ncbi:MAG: cobalt-precorrin-5B (C(1))-methyltransferase CbiD, partial [Marinilabilia sp.]